MHSFNNNSKIFMYTQDYIFEVSCANYFSSFQVIFEVMLSYNVELSGFLIGRYKRDMEPSDPPFVYDDKHGKFEKDKDMHN